MVQRRRNVPRWRTWWRRRSSSTPQLPQVVWAVGAEEDEDEDEEEAAVASDLINMIILKEHSKN